MTRLAVPLVLLLGGCSFLSAKKDPTRFFVLTTVDKAAPPNNMTAVVGVERVDLPEYLVRDQMVTRLASNQLDIADYDRWGEPLRDGFARVLKRDLESELGASHVAAQPYDPAHVPTILLEVEVRHFEHVAGRGALLEATWTLREKGAKEAMVTHETKQQEPAADKNPSAEAGAMSKALAKLAAEIATELRDKK